MPTLASDTFGDPADPPVLLIMGATASLVWWPEGFCRQLAGGGRFVIRYDNRDTGRSTAYAPGTLNYTIDDLADDARAVLDAYGLPRAHVVGMSLGGLIAQTLALTAPARVLTLTLLATTPYGPVDPPLPGMDPALLAAMSAAAPPDWADPAAATAYLVESWRRMAGPAHPFDELAIRRLAAADVARSPHLASSFNHALLEAVPLPPRDMGAIRAPTLVIHGTADPVLPLAHGEAIAHRIPGADVLTLAGVGHELPAAEWPRIAAAIVAHTARVALPARDV